jgi:hypothetical protein
MSPNAAAEAVCNDVVCIGHYLTDNPDMFRSIISCRCFANKGNA